MPAISHSAAPEPLAQRVSDLENRIAALESVYTLRAPLTPDRRVKFETFLIAAGLKRKEVLFELGWSWSKLCKYLRNEYVDGAKPDRECHHLLQSFSSIC